MSAYRTIDLALFALLLIVTESLIVRASRVWYADQLYTVSVAAAVTGIVMMRWGAWGLAHAALAGLVFSLASGGSAKQIAVYTIGNLFAAAGLLVRRAAGRERITGDGLMALVYAAITQLSMQGGRAAVSVLTGTKPVDSLVFFTTDSLSILFTMLILWIARRQDGLLEDQKAYLVRIHREESDKRKEADGDFEEQLYSRDKEN